MDLRVLGSWPNVTLPYTSMAVVSTMIRDRRASMVALVSPTASPQRKPAIGADQNQGDVLIGHLRRQSFDLRLREEPGRLGALSRQRHVDGRVESQPPVGDGRRQTLAQGEHRLADLTGDSPLATISATHARTAPLLIFRSGVAPNLGRAKWSTASRVGTG